MKKEKIYFGKSNLASTEDVRRVRDFLKSFDVELIEFKGGKYDNSPLLSSDYLVILPETPDYYETNVGRGLYEQIEEFTSVNQRENIFIISEIDGDDVELSELISLDFLDEDWTSNFGTVELGDNVDLNDLFSQKEEEDKEYEKEEHDFFESDDTDFKEENNVNTSNSKYKYLLIG